MGTWLLASFRVVVLDFRCTFSKVLREKMVCVDGGQFLKSQNWRKVLLNIHTQTGTPRFWQRCLGMVVGQFGLWFVIQTGSETVSSGSRVFRLWVAHSSNLQSVLYIVLPLQLLCQIFFFEKHFFNMDFNMIERTSVVRHGPGKSKTLKLSSKFHSKNILAWYSGYGKKMGWKTVRLFFEIWTFWNGSGFRKDGKNAFRSRVLDVLKYTG